jgi:CHAT domain-containing protein/tetratricopeptide (TPR) repeat protein
MIARHLWPCLVALSALLGAGLTGDVAARPTEEVTQSNGVVSATPKSDAPPPKVSQAVLDVFHQVDWLSLCHETTRAEFEQSEWSTRPDEPLSLVVLAGWARQDRTAIEVANRMLQVADDNGDRVGKALALHLRGSALGSLAMREGSPIESSTADLRAAAQEWDRVEAGPERADALLTAVLQLSSTGDDSEEAERLLGEALAVAQVETKRPLAVAKTLFEVGDYALRAIGAMPLALRLLEASLAIRERVVPDSLEVAETLEALGSLEVGRGRPSSGLTYLERAQTLTDKLAPASLQAASVLTKLGHANLEIWELWRAEECYRRSLEICEQLAASSVEAQGGVAGALNSLGVVRCRRDDLLQSRAYFERAVEAWERLLPGAADEIVTIQNLGHCASKGGDFAAADDYFKRALALAEKKAPEGIRAADIVWEMGLNAQSQGDLVDARALMSRALTVFERLKPDSSDTAGLLSGLGSVARDEGELDEARASIERALVILVKLGEGSLDTAAAERDLGQVLDAQGDPSGAEAHLLRALAIADAIDVNHPLIPSILDSLGSLTLRLGKLDAAERHYQRAIAIREASLGSGHFLLSESLSGLAEALWREGQPEHALDASLRAEAIRTDHLRSALRFSAESQALRYSVWRPRALDVGLEIAASRFADDPEVIRIVWSALIASRGLVLDAFASRRRSLGQTADPEVSLAADAYASACARVARIAVRGPQDEPVEAYRRVLDEATEQKEEAGQNLARVSAAVAGTYADRRVGYVDVDGAFPAHTALAAFVLVNSAHQNGLPQHRQPGRGPATSYVAFVLPGRGQPPAVVPIGGVEEVHALVADVRLRVAQSLTPGAPPALSEAAYRRAAERLRRSVWDPLEPHLRGAASLFIVPDGALNLVNFAALPTGASAYLIETGPRLHYLSAERDLLSPGNAEGTGVLAVGDPAFDEGELFAALRRVDSPFPQGDIEIASARVFRGQPSSCGDFKSLHFEPLPSTRAEVEDVASAWRGARADSEHRLRGPDSAANGQVLEGAAAHELAVKLAAPGKDVLHLATHGFFLGEGCPSALDAREGATGGPVPAALLGENPLLLAGLALAGANRRDAAGTDEEDGILTAEEIAAMDLSGVQWAVLSACDTGLGQIRAGEGVLGLRRAFQIAGARTVIMSLWPVEDEASRQWMRALYANRLSRGMSTVDAVHAASLEQLRQRRDAGLSTHPFYWAGFVATGDWR